MVEYSKEAAESKAPAAAKAVSVDAHDADQLRLQQMGHEQELKRHFTVWSLIGLASTTTISWTGLGLGLITEINAGGPGAVIYGFILVWILQCFLGASLAEFVSAYPTEGGMYHWVAAIAPRKYSGFLSFITGWWSCCGWIFTTASTNLVYAQNFMALIALYRSDLVIETWMTFVVYQITNLATASIVLFGNRIIPALNRFSLFYLQLAWFVLMVTVAACAPRHNSAEFVFRTWVNNTGWQSPAICFITGLVNPLYSLGGLDGITHITEEMPDPSRNAPLALLITLAIALVTGLTYLITLMFSVQDYAALADTSTGLPLAELFRQATSSTGGAFALVFLLWVALGPCMVGSQLSTSRVVWAFARDAGLPWSPQLSRVSARFGVPFNAQLLVTACCAALGCLYLGSSTAFNAMLGSAVTINNIAYLVPLATNLLQRRRVLVRGKFHMGAAKGMVVNAVAVAWLVFAIVFFSFPYVMPVDAESMNYTCVCVGGIGIIALTWWFVAGARFTEKMARAKEDDEAKKEAAEAVLRGVVVTAKEGGEEGAGH
ncbi:putative choline transporter [Diplodia seriata]|uniref:Putative choline transporter n=2 Tax=Diplodia seriata TaxID=420778 RepID=A0A0G2DX39_9PEZI|nr:putative choline transporter [Diplodia seriata]